MSRHSGAPSLASEQLEPRAMLAVSASLTGGDLLITYNAPGDLMADISSDGTKYTVAGTGLASSTFTIADVTGVIKVSDNAGLFGQEFKVLTGTALANPLQVNANVEATLLGGGITATKAGDVLIGSAAITLANDISTAATNANVAFTGAVTLAKNTTVNAGAGAITFNGTVDGGFTLTANSTGATTFAGVVGGATPLVSLATNAGGTASLLGVTTSGTQTYNDDTVTLTGTYTTTNANFFVDKNTTLAGNTTIDAGAGAITFNGTVDGGFTLTVADANDVYFRGKVGPNAPLAGITLQKAESVTAADTISLDGTPALATDGITIAAGVNKVSLTKDGSTIQKFSANGIWFKGGSTDSRISGFKINANGGDGVRLDAGGYSGTTISANSISDNEGNGVRLTAATGPVSIADNDIDFNDLNGVYADNSTTVSIFGNSIISNENHGVWVLGGDGVIADNDIINNDLNGVLLAGPYDVTDNLIELNRHGIEVVTGLTDLDITDNDITDNVLDGIFFNAGGVTGFNVSGNDISLNELHGIKVDAGDYTGTVIRSNQIYLNNFDGIFLNAGSAVSKITNLLIGGGTAATLGNEIYENGATTGSNGIATTTGDLAGTVIAGNTIRDNGTKSPTAPALPTGNGILVEGSNLMIGWTATAGQPNAVANTITGNALNGIEIRGAGALNNTILSNSIFENGYVDMSVVGQKTVVGEGIALTGGNGNQAAPVILRAVDDDSSGVIRVLLTVPQDGDYYVQLFDNTPADEREIFPADTNGFEGRTYIGDRPAQAGTAVGTTKPQIAGTLVTGNTLEVIEIPAGRVPAGNWITATATRVTGTTPLGTSPFSEGVQRQDAPVLAVGTVGQRTWSQEFTYSLLGRNQLRVTGLSPAFAAALAGLVNTPIVVTPAQAAAGGNVSRTVANGQLEADGSVILNLTPGGALPDGGGTLVLGVATLPAAQLYDTSTAAASPQPVFAVGPVRISSALTSAGVPAANAAAFVNRYQGGLRVASGDLDGDGFVDLVTAPGAAPATLAAAFGDAARVITIFNGNPAGGWESASVNVASVFGGSYTGGFLVALGDVHPENAGSGSIVAELIVASTGKVAVFEVQVPARGGQPVIGAGPIASWTTTATVTGIAAGDFSTGPRDLVVVATTTTNGDAAPSADMATAKVQTFAIAAGSFVPQREFRVTSQVQNGPPGSGFMQNVFLNGATLAVGDIDGTLTVEAGRSRLKPELVLASQSMGLGNFRVLANDLVAGGVQAPIDTALTNGNGFTRESRTQTDGNQVWQPAGGPDYFVGTTVPVPTAGGANAGLAIAVVDADGRADLAGRGKAEVFASLNANATLDGKLFRKLSWNPATDSWQGVDALFTGLVSAPDVNADIDLDGNGTGDLIWVNDEGVADAWLDGDSTTTRPLGGGGGWSVAATGDFNADGVTDLVWRSPAGIYVVWLMNGGGSTLEQGFIGGGGGWELAATGDYDGDGRTDLVWRHGPSGASVMWLMNGFTASSQSVVGGNLDWRLVPTDAHFDANGDGRTDLIWRHAVSGVNVLWRMNGGSLISAMALGGDATWRISGTGDFDGDGQGDILWRNSTTGDVVMHVLDDGTVRDARAIGGDTTWSVVTTLRTDATGRSRLFWQALDGTTVRWNMIGTTIESTSPVRSAGVWRLLGLGRLGIS